jgi:hypothetical protein
MAPPVDLQAGRHPVAPGLGAQNSTAHSAGKARVPCALDVLRDELEAGLATDWCGTLFLTPALLCYTRKERCGKWNGAADEIDDIAILMLLFGCFCRLANAQDICPQSRRAQGHSNNKLKLSPFLFHYAPSTFIKYKEPL